MVNEEEDKKIIKLKNVRVGDNLYIKINDSLYFESAVRDIITMNTFNKIIKLAECDCGSQYDLEYGCCLDISGGNGKAICGLRNFNTN